MQAFNLFVSIMLGGVGYSNSLLLVLAQTYASGFLVVRTMFNAMRSRSLAVKTLAILIPMVIGGTYLIASSIIFGAFFGDAWTSYELVRLVAQTLTRDFIYELLAWLGAFAVLTIIYSLLYRTRLWEWLLTFSLEIFAALALLVMYGGLLLDGFPFTIVDLCQINIFLVKLTIYGIFMIIFKDFVLLTSIIIGLLLREPKVSSDFPENYSDQQLFYEKQAKHYLTRDYMAIGVSLFLFGCLATAMFGWIMLDEFSGKPFPPELNSDEYIGLFFIIVITLVTICYALIGLLMIFRRLFPQTARIYRRLLALTPQCGDQTELLRLFYKEIIIGFPSGENPKQSFLAKKNILSSEHFIMEKKGLKTTIKWREVPLPKTREEAAEAQRAAFHARKAASDKNTQTERYDEM